MLKAKRAAAMMVWLTGAGGAVLPAVPCGATSVEETAKLTASDGPDGHQFGISVSVAGDTAVVGANGDDDAGTASGSAYTFRYNGAAWVEEAKLTASDAAAGDGFGISVSVAGDTAVVGARFDDDAGIASGSAYVFRYNGAAWVEEAKLTASDAAAGDGFGASVAVADDIVVVGAGSNTDAGTRSGSAYVFRYNGAAWVEEAKLTASDAAAEDLFGVSVAVADKTAVVGAFGNDDNGSLSGSAYIFRYNGAAWVEEAKLTASDAAAGDHFGISVAVAALNVLTGAGETAVVGAFGDDDSGSVSGSAYIFRYNGAAWVEEAKLTASDAAAEDQFGVSVAVADETAVVGADLDDDNGSFSGSAYIFRYNGAAWVEEAKLTASDAAAGDHFGISVAVAALNVLTGAGETAVVGAFGDDDSGSVSGSAYIFRYNGAAWVEEAKLTASDAAAEDQFGVSVAVADETAVVGADLDDDNGSFSGSAYIFRYNGAAWVEEAKLTASDAAAGDQFGVSVAVSGDTTLVGAFLAEDNGRGSAYVFVPDPATLALQLAAMATLAALARRTRRHPR